MILLRHAEADDAYAGRCYGSIDVALSRAGHEHARLIAERLADQSISLVASSPRRRAMDTARPVAARHGLSISVLADLREMDFGTIEGCTYSEVEETMPDLWHQWMTDPTALRFPHGESYEDLCTRACLAVDTLRHNNPSHTIVVVAHGGVLRAVLADALQLAPRNIFRLDQSYGAINVIDWFHDTPLVRIVNG